ncbi:hypothetical protein M8J77_007404 [Diaphorina citri]|nr:hypothetical protein M8J77_007404 [Diaphorina citri]
MVFQYRAVSRTPDTDISDSGVISLSPSEDIYCSDSDLHDIHVKLEPTSSSMGGDVKERLSLLCQSLDNVSERIIIQQAINLLRHYEARISGMEATVSNMCQEVAMCRSMSSPEDSPPSTGSPSSTVDPCRKPSPRIIATVLPFSALPNPRQEDTRPFCSLPNPSRPDEEEEEDLMTIESPFRKLFRENDSMQESGIYFEDEDLGFHCQGTQTDSANQSRLSEELRKLSQIRQKLEQEQEREKYFKPIKEDKSKIMCSRQELEYYKEEMERLELRLQLYESCGEEHNARLKTMLERDEILKKQLHRLEEDNMKLRRDNQFLEMEKCEYEELENDTRLQCQRLEVKLNSMNEKKLELQTQLSHNARLINNLKSNLEDNDKSKAEAAERLQAAQDRIQSLETTISCYETSLNKCEQKNFELEEKEMELKYRVYLLENILPVLISYHLYWIVERSRAFSRQCTSSKYEMISCDNSSNSVLPLSSKSNRIDNTRALALLDVESPEQSRIDHTENKHSELNATSHSIPNKCHIETQTMFDDMAILRNECQCQLRVHTDSSEGDSESPLPNDECISQTSQKSQPNEPHINSSEQLQCENCANNNTTATLNMEKIEELNRMISDLKIKEKLYEQTMSEADEMFSNMTLEYGVQIENLENQINTTTLDLRAMKKELEKEREENDRMSNGNVELMKEIKAKENEKKQLNNMLECLKMQLEEEREESLKFKQEISSFKKLFETEKSKCKELEMDLKEANREIKEIESRVESSMKSHDKEMDRMSKKLEDMVVTNGELKEEVDTLENVVKELKLALNHERYRRESLKSELSRELQLKTQELSDLRRHMQGVGLKTTAQEMEEALASLEHKDEDDGCHLSITEIPDQLEKLTEKLSESQDHTQTCELCKNNLSVIVQELMDQIATIKTSKICQGPHSDDVYKMATLPRIKTTSSHTSTGNSKHPPNPSHSNLDSNSVTQSTLQSKCQEKDLLIFNLAFELKQLADRNLWVRYPALVDNLRKHISDCPDFNRVLLVQYLNGKLVMTPKFSEKSLLDLRIIKAVGSNSLLIAWKPPPPEYAVLEFLVYINGEYLRKIYAEQGRALLHPVQILQLDKPIQVTLMSADAKYPSASAYYC